MDYQMEDQNECSKLSLSESVWDTVVVILGVDSEVETDGVPNGRLWPLLTDECI